MVDNQLSWNVEIVMMPQYLFMFFMLMLLLRSSIIKIKYDQTNCEISFIIFLWTNSKNIKPNVTFFPPTKINNNYYIFFSDYHNTWTENREYWAPIDLNCSCGTPCWSEVSDTHKKLTKWQLKLGDDCLHMSQIKTAKQISDWKTNKQTPTSVPLPHYQQGFGDATITCHFS